MCERVDEEVEYYNIITEKHMNLFAEGILTSCRYNNIYPFTDTMKFDYSGKDQSSQLMNSTFRMSTTWVCVWEKLIFLLRLPESISRDCVV